MTTIEDFFGNIGRRRARPAVPPYPHADPDAVADSRSTGRTRRFFVRALLVLLLLLLVFFARFIPDTWNPFGATGIFAAEGTANGSPGDGLAVVPGSTAAPNQQGSGADGRNGADGEPGAQGPRGADGAPGTDGVNGADGMNGADGADGEAGAQGQAGPMGPVGSLGQSNSDISACDDNIVVSLRSSWSPSNSEFRVARILMSDVSATCSGLYLGFDLLDARGESLAHIDVASLSVVGGSVTLLASDFPALGTVRSVEVARVAMEIAS